MPRVGFEPTISAGERSKTYALDRAATGTGQLNLVYSFKQISIVIFNHARSKHWRPYVLQWSLKFQKLWSKRTEQFKAGLGG